MTQFTYNITDKWQKICWQEPEEFQLSQNVTIICNAPCKVQVLLNTHRPIAFFPKHTGEKEWCYTYKYTRFFMPHIINKIFTITIHAHKIGSFGTLNNTASLF